MALFSGRNQVMNNMQGQPTTPVAIPYANKSAVTSVHMDNKPSNNNKVSNPKRRAKVCDSETDDDDRDIYKQLADLDSSQLFEWFMMKAEQ